MADARAAVPVTYKYGMTAAQAETVEQIAGRLGTQPFSIGQFCNVTGRKAADCTSVFAELVALGALRCPVNDGGCQLYQLVPDLV